MTLRTTCGIVLTIAEHGESDKLVTFYSNDLGRVTGIAKGAKKSKHRFVNKLEEFSCLHIFYRPPRGLSGLFFIGEAELLCAHLAIRQDYRRYVCAMYLSELMLRFTRDHDPDPGLYALLKWGLASLELADIPQKITVLFHLQLLTAAGYRPELNRCGNCHQPVGPGRSYIFLPGTGSLLCSSCQPRQDGPNFNRLSVQTLKFLARAQLAGLEQLNRLQLSGPTIVEALEALHHYTFHLMQQDLRCWQVMRSLNTTPVRKRPPTANHGGNISCPSC